MSSSRTGHRRLHHDRAASSSRGHEVHGRAGDLHAVLERLALRVDAGERRQQRRVDVEDRVRERVEERRADQPHEAGEADERDAARAQLVRDRARRTSSRDGERAVIDDERLDARPPRHASSPAALAPVRDDDGDRAPRAGRRRSASMSACRLLPRPEIRTPIVRSLRPPASRRLGRSRPRRRARSRR